MAGLGWQTLEMLLSGAMEAAEREAKLCTFRFSLLVSRNAATIHVPLANHCTHQETLFLNIAVLCPIPDFVR